MKTIPMLVLTLSLLVAAAAAADFQMQSVESSLIDQIGYDAETETMAVQMQNSSDVYIYQDVPQSVFNEFLSAPSKGRYFVENIKGQYQARRRE